MPSLLAYILTKMFVWNYFLLDHILRPLLYELNGNDYRVYSLHFKHLHR